MTKAEPARGRFWRRALWGLVWPSRRERIQPTISGLVLFALAFGVGTAAYNSSSNILFIALSLLLACLILSGVLSWLNLRAVTWELEAEPPLRAGDPAEVAVVVANKKGFLPTYALWFDFCAHPHERQPQARPETTLTAKGIDVWAALRRRPDEQTAVVHLRTRLAPKESTRLTWMLTPAARGLLRIEVRSVGSLFPFGFLRKSSSLSLSRDVPVWPAPIEYRRLSAGPALRPSGERRQPRAGSEGDMIALRAYDPGDSHRLIHWKASARQGKLLVRQFSAQTSEACAMAVPTDAQTWKSPEQFELLMSFAATLAEDLFHAGRLQSAVLEGEPPVLTRRLADLERFLDLLAEAKPRPETTPGQTPGTPRLEVVTFQPDGAHGVAAFVHGIKTAAA